jgi:hypothetical protein
MQIRLFRPVQYRAENSAGRFMAPEHCLRPEFAQTKLFLGKKVFNNYLQKEIADGFYLMLA